MTTHEEKLRSILPEHTVDVVRNEAIDDCFNSIVDKVILREELLTIGGISNIVNDIWDNPSCGIRCNKPDDVVIIELVYKLFEAQNKKAGLV